MAARKTQEHRPQPAPPPSPAKRVEAFNSAFDRGAPVLVANGRAEPRSGHVMGPAKLVTLALVQVSGLGWVPVDQVKHDTSAGAPTEGTFEEDLAETFGGAATR